MSASFCQIIHFTSFAEMKKRQQHCIAEDDEKDFVNMAMAQKDGGFFRQGKKDLMDLALAQNDGGFFRQGKKDLMDLASAQNDGGFFR